MPSGADKLFALVNRYMAFYRFINPAKYSLRHTLLHRHTMIDRLLTAASCPQTIEIAAGFSPRGAAVSRNPDINYYEVDLEAVVALKRRQLESSEEGAEVLARANFHQRVGDVMTMDFVQAFPPRPSFIITEGLMMYFERDEQLAVWARIAEFLRHRGGEYVFDYIPLDIEPERSPVGRALHQVKELLGGDGQGYCYDQRTRWDIRDDLLSAGFQQVDILDSSVKAREWQLPYADTETRVLVYHCC